MVRWRIPICLHGYTIRLLPHRLLTYPTRSVLPVLYVSDEVLRQNLPVPEIDCSSTSHDVTDFITSHDGGIVGIVLRVMRAAAELLIGRP